MLDDMLKMEAGKPNMGRRVSRIANVNNRQSMKIDQSDLAASQRRGLGQP